ncbi:MAG: hypothetical protein EA357_05135 [Micavibrio sp.]|nr:MAG: hypothetical protein EA357_05135 [Micavibrio sp.]
MSKLRVLLGFWVAPGIPALLFYFYFYALFDSAMEAFFLPVIFAFFAYLVVWVFGIPGYFLLQKKGISSFTAYLVLGMCIGLTVPVGLSISMVWSMDSEYALSVFTGAVLGFGKTAVVYAVIASAIFWLIAVRKNGVSLSGKGLRVIISFLIAPIIPVLFLFIDFFIVFFISDDRNVPPFFSILIFFAYQAVWIVATPVCFFLRKKAVHSPAVYLGLGALAGLTVCILFLMCMWCISAYIATEMLKNPIIYGIIAFGACVSALFWLTAVWKNPKLSGY